MKHPRPSSPVPNGKRITLSDPHILWLDADDFCNFSHCCWTPHIHQHPEVEYPLTHDSNIPRRTIIPVHYPRLISTLSRIDRVYHGSQVFILGKWKPRA